MTIDTTVVRNRILKQALMSTLENEVIAKHLGTIISGELQANGYQADEVYRTTGLTRLEKIDHQSNHVNISADPILKDAAFVFKPQSTLMGKAQLAQLQRDIGQSKLAPESNHVAQVGMVINASGFYISGSELVGNFGKGAINTLVFTAAILGQGYVESMEFNKDTLILTLRLFDLHTGNLLWEDYVRIFDDPSADNFARELQWMLKKLLKCRIS